MVMDAPSPQCVGREFVRQYYTLLNKAPLHLHRFYNHNSSFLHGSIDPPGQETKPVVGQQAIHQKIMQLNFKDCHAKIRQVDSHETLDNGVVVQVSGELSNNGQPMRSFMQTFVLAPQSPKKYYVRNDIFRYQDDFYTDEDEVENDNAVTDADSEEVSNQKPVTNQLQESENVSYYEPENMRNGTVHASETLNKYAPPPPPPPQQQPQQQQAPPEAAESPQPALDVESPKSEWEDEEEEEEEEEEELEDANITIERTENSAPAEPESTPTMSQEPKTYANMVSKNTSVGGPSSVPSSSSATSPVSSQTPVTVKSEQSSGFHPSDGGINAQGHFGSTSQIGSSFGPQSHRVSRPRMNSGRGGGMARYEGRDNTARSPEDFDPEKRKPSFIHYPDSQQLFVGNLTHSITEDDLKNHFNQYGTVLDMRINTKQAQKTSGGKITPNYGFIVFEDAESVQKVLDKRPIYFNDHRLNVEEKKRPKDNRMLPGDNRIGPGRGGGLPARLNMSGRGGRGGMLGSQGAGRGESRGGMKGGGYSLRR